MLLVALLGCAHNPTAEHPTAATDPLQVLHDWDAARALAWERADPAALERLYLPGAAVGRRDLVLLRRYQARGVRLSGMQMQVLSARVEVKQSTRLRLVVVERFAGAHVESAAGARQLPAGVPVTRVIELRKPGERWLVSSVRQLPPAEPR